MLLINQDGQVHFVRYKVQNKAVDMAIPFLDQTEADEYAAEIDSEVTEVPVNPADEWIEGKVFNNTDEAKEALKLGPEAYERTRKRTSQELISVLGTDLVKERLARMQVEKQLKVLGQSVVALRVANMQGGKA